MQTTNRKQSKKQNKAITPKTRRKFADSQENLEKLIAERTAALKREIDHLRTELAEYKRHEIVNCVGAGARAKKIKDEAQLSARQYLQKALTELELSHSQLEALFAAQNDVVILYDTEMNVYKANPSFLANYGFDPTGLNVKEIIQRVSSQCLDGRTLVFEKQPTPRALGGEKVSGLQFRVKKADGSEVIVETSSGPVRIGKKIVGTVTVWHDITEAKKVEKELLTHKACLETARQESEERYQDLFKKSPEPIILHDGVRILEANPAIGELLGYQKPEDLIGTNILNIVAPEYRELASSRIRLILDKEVSTPSKEINLLRKDGSLVIVESIGGICHYLGHRVIQGVFHDISERKQLEIMLTNRSIELSHALATLEAMLNTIPIGVMVAEAGSERVTYSSLATQEILGVPLRGTASGPEPGELRRIKMLRADRSEIPPDDWPLVLALRDGWNTENEEIIVQRDDGREVTTVMNCTPVRNDNDQILRAIASIVNITKRKQMENALRESEERFRILTEALPQLVWMMDEAGNFKYLNSQFYYYTGIKTEQLMELDWRVIIHPEDNQKRNQSWKEAIHHGNTYQIEYRIKRYDGEYRWFLGRGLPLRDKQQKIIYWFGTCTDIHYQKELEMELQETNARLYQLNKQAMITLEEERRMISRELHDEAGQALTALKMYIELILKGLSADANGLQQKITEAVKLSDQTLKEIRRLAQDLRPPALDALGLNFTLEDFCYEFSQRVGLHIEYQGCEIPALTGIARISLYRFLQEALTNVVKHAQADLVHVKLDYHGQQVFLVVKDNGSGFELHHQEIKGESIGLLGMRERLAMLGGVLTIDTKPGQGTRLMATIPWEGVS